MSWWIFLIAIVAIVPIAWGCQHFFGIPFPLGAIENELIGLLNAEDYTKLILTVPRLPDRIEVRRYAQSPGYGLCLVVSNDAVSPERFEAMRAFVTTQAKECVTREIDAGVGSRLELRIDLRDDTAGAARLLIELFGQVYGLTRDVHLVSKARGSTSESNPAEERISH